MPGTDQGIFLSNSSRELYALYRDLAKHEDNLLNERLKTLFTAETLLFGVAAVFWGTQKLPFIALAAFGVLLVISFRKDIGNSAFATGQILKRWTAVRDTLPDRELLPPLVGLDVRQTNWWLLPGTFIPWVITAVWVFIAVFRIFSP